ncbi:MAG: magnesium transporter [Candidatus Lokiarchaeota archaeon]|nr:magnesium transporter [Candidatus Lokiarchaeota archaeon]
MEYFNKIIKESIIIVIASSLIGLVSGTFLSFNDSIFYSFPIILLILPSLNSLLGNVLIVLISRLTTHLFIGTIVPKIEISENLKKDFIGLTVTILLSLLFLIIFGYFVGYIQGIKIINPFLIIFIITLTIVVLFVIFFFLLFVVAIFLFKKGKDPNNFLIPLVTSLADFFTPFTLILFIQIFI